MGEKGVIVVNQRPVVKLSTMTWTKVQTKHDGSKSQLQHLSRLPSFLSDSWTWTVGRYVGEGEGEVGHLPRKREKNKT